MGAKITMHQLKEEHDELKKQFDRVAENIEEVKRLLQDVGIGAGAVTLKQVVERHTLQLDGDGNGNPGLRGNVRDLMADRAIARWLLASLTLAVAGLVAKQVVQLFFAG